MALVATCFIPIFICRYLVFTSTVHFAMTPLVLAVQAFWNIFDFFLLISAIFQFW